MTDQGLVDLYCDQLKALLLAWHKASDTARKAFLAVIAEDK